MHGELSSITSLCVDDGGVYRRVSHRYVCAVGGVWKMIIFASLSIQAIL